MSGPLTVRWHQGEETFMPGSVVRIGRDPLCQVVLDNPNVSRIHLVVRHDGEVWVLADEGSAQGTFKDGQRVTDLRLEGHQELVLGSPRVGQRIGLGVGDDVPTHLRASTAAVPDDEGPVTVVGGRDRPGGDLRRNAFESATIVAGTSLRLECGEQSQVFMPGKDIVVGRDPAADVVTTNPTVSRRHAVIRHDGDGWRIDDAGSQGGIYVEGKRSTTHQLDGSTVVFLGDPQAGERLLLTSGEVPRTAEPDREHHRNRLKFGIAGAAVLTMLIVITLILSTGGSDLDELARSVVSLSTDQGLLGSGTIIDAEQGLILTNAHVVAPRAPGQGVTVGQLEGQLPEEPREVIVGVSSGRDRPSEPRFRAEVVVVDGYLDLAVIQIRRTLTGSLVERSDLAGLRAGQLGASERLRSGDQIRILGHPAVAQSNAATLTEGVVAGIVADARLNSNRAYINLDATIRQGNSGGLVADRRGRVVGVPTLNWIGGSTNTPVAAMRPIDLASDLVEAARAGEAYTSPYVTPLTGTEALTGIDLVVAGSDDVRMGCDLPSRLPAAGDTVLGVLVEYEGFVTGSHQDLWVGIWDPAVEGYLGATSTATTWPVEFAGRGCITLPVFLDQPLRGGDEYEIDVHVGPNLTSLGGGYAFSVRG